MDTWPELTHELIDAASRINPHFTIGALASALIDGNPSGAAAAALAGMIGETR